MEHGKIEFTTRAENNFNFLRLSAAVLVIVSHAFELPTGLARHDLIFYLTGYSISWYAVNVFFVVSGYLILTSWERRPSLSAFAWARFLRIYPGLFIALILSVALLGIFFSTLPLSQYLSNDRTLRYLAGSLSIVYVQYDLPGVFENTPQPTVNGSLWTLRYELLCYVGIALAGSIGILRTSSTRRRLFTSVVVVSSIALVYLDARDMHQQGGKLAMLYELARLAMCFALGSLYLGMEKVLPLKVTILTALFLLMVVAVGTSLFVPVANIAIAYCTIWLAFVPGGKFAAWARSAPDYSYGVYIYAFPIQQALVATFPTATPAANFMLALAISLAFAAMSWHFVERPALSHKKLFSGMHPSKQRRPQELS
jgi:peptidoglycan/LPS O-acetylase OafA/YrhL